jgi:hypothetical protein
MTDADDDNDSDGGGGDDDDDDDDVYAQFIDQTKIEYPK